MACPYLEELIKDHRGPLRVYHYECHVVGRSKVKLALHDAPPICVHHFAECRLYRAERAREDHVIDRYRD